MCFLLALALLLISSMNRRCPGSIEVPLLLPPLLDEVALLGCGTLSLADPSRYPHRCLHHPDLRHHHPRHCCLHCYARSLSPPSLSWAIAAPLRRGAITAACSVQPPPIIIVYPYKILTKLVFHWLNLPNFTATKPIIIVYPYKTFLRYRRCA